MRVYCFGETREPRVGILNEIVQELAAAGAGDDQIVTLVYDLEHTGFAYISTPNGRYNLLKGSLVDSIRATPKLAIVKDGMA